MNTTWQTKYVVNQKIFFLNMNRYQNQMSSDSINKQISQQLNKEGTTL